MSRWLREPLLHFLAAGAIVFAIDQAIASRRPDPNVITIGTAVDAELKAIYKSAKGREPDAEELRVLRQRWFDNEMLYREGLELGLDRGDTGIRERVIFKALNVVSSNVALPQISDAELRAWFESNRGRYDEPERVDFLEAVVEGSPGLDKVASFAAMLNQGGRMEADVQSGLRVFKGRPVATLEPAFGAEFAARLVALPTGQWHALASKEGPRAIRVEARSAGAPARFEALRETVLQDWREQRMAELRTEAVRSLARKYTLRVSGEAR
jgi:hypothetical protein